MLKIITMVILTSFWSISSAQEYLPPKSGGAGGGSKKPILEPTINLPANYNFSYDVQENNFKLDFGHNEKRKDDRVTGSFHVLLPDSRIQLVEYEAGPEGYKPQIMYMGTAQFPSNNANGGGGDKFEGYHYNAASNRQSVRQVAPRGVPRIVSITPPAPAQQLLATPDVESTNATLYS